MFFSMVILDIAAVFLGQSQYLQIKPQDVQGLTPLVRDVTQHLAHGSQTDLMSKELLLLPELLQYPKVLRRFHLQPMIRLLQFRILSLLLCQYRIQCSVR